MTITKRCALIVAILISCVGCDQATKMAAQLWLAESQVSSFLGDTFRLQLAHNTGAFLSLGSALPEAWRAAIFSIGTGGLLLILLGYTLFSKSATSLEILAYSLLLAGGVGNLVDRVLCGYVVDFMNIGIGSLRTGIFNVADIVISMGALILMFEALPKRSPKEG